MAHVISEECVACGICAEECPAEAIKKGEYPITRSLYLYLRNRPSGETKKFVDWVLGPEGQSVVTEVGYFPIK